MIMLHWCALFLFLHSFVPLFIVVLLLLLLLLFLYTVSLTAKCIPPSLPLTHVLSPLLFHSHFFPFVSSCLVLSRFSFFSFSPVQWMNESTVLRSSKCQWIWWVPLELIRFFLTIGTVWLCIYSYTIIIPILITHNNWLEIIDWLYYYFGMAIQIIVSKNYVFIISKK